MSATDPPQRQAAPPGVPDPEEEDAYSPPEGMVVDPLLRYTEDMLEANRPTAPLRIPPSDQLEVRLVNVADLRRLDELRSDVAVLGSLFWTFVGALLGFLGNLVSSGGVIDRQAWIYVGLLSVFLAVLGGLFLRAARRAMGHRRRLLGDTEDIRPEKAIEQ